MDVKVMYQEFIIYAGWVSCETIRRYEAAGFTVTAA